MVSNKDLYRDIPKAKLPKIWFKYYIIYKYQWSNIFIIGFNNDIEAAKIQFELLSHTGIVRCELYGHYPVELLRE